MKPGSIHGLLVFTPSPHRDERGFFSRTFDAEVAQAHGLDPHGFSQDSLSRSARGVIRGLHLRSGMGEAKLVRCSYGVVFDVVLDLRQIRRRSCDGSPLTSETTLVNPSTSHLDVPMDFRRSLSLQTSPIESTALTTPAKISHRLRRPRSTNSLATHTFHALRTRPQSLAGIYYCWKSSRLVL